MSLHAIESRSGKHAADKYDKGSTGADEQRVGEDAQRLYQSLLDGMRHAGNAGCAGSRSLTGLIGEQAALDAIHHRRTKCATGKLLQAKGIGEDDGEDMWYQPEIHEDDDQGQHHIENGHHGHNDTGHFGDATDAAKDAERGQHDEDETHDERRHAKGFVSGGTDGVALYGDVSHAERHRDKDSIEPSPSAACEVRTSCNRPDHR